MREGYDLGRPEASINFRRGVETEDKRKGKKYSV